MNIQDVVIIIVAGTAVLLLLCGFIVYFIFIYRQRQQQNMQELDKIQAQFTHTLLQSQIEIQEQTLQHISNELHDNIAQMASIIKINLHTIDLHDVHKAAQKLEDTRELTRQLIGDIRGLSINFNGDRVAQMGLSRALQTEIERINKTELFTASFEQEGDLLPVNDDKAIILYRMVQEILNNTVKHSSAKAIKLTLCSNEHAITLLVSDDGKGFNVDEKLQNGGGAGLYNLKKRAAVLNAILTIESYIGNGTTIAIEIPYSSISNAVNGVELVTDIPVLTQ
jgi:signal transduction histidine kinase